MLVTFSTLNKTPENQKYLFGLIATIFIACGLILNVIQPGFLLTDGGIFGAVAYKDLNGGTLYLDAWENKPPGIFYLIECFMLVIPDPVYAVFVLAFSGLLTLSILVYTFLFRSFKSLSLTLLINGLAMYFILHANNIGDGLYTEIYGCIFLLAGLVAGQSYSRKNSKTKLALSYVFLGFSFWFKEPFFISSVIGAFLVYLDSKRLFNIFQSLAWFIAPSIFFILILFTQGALNGFLEMLSYNVSYIGGETQTSIKVKFNNLYENLLVLIPTPLLLALYMAYKGLSDRQERLSLILKCLLFLSTFLHISLSPYNFGHYYLPFFTFTFIFIGYAYESMKDNAKSLKVPLILLSIFTIYQFDDKHRYERKYEITGYQADRIVERLRTEKDMKLFVDYVNRVDLYLKARKVPPTFVPVALPVHFQEDARGLENRKKIYSEIENSKPDYVITTFTTAYFSWFMPNSPYYENNYEKVDSLPQANENIIMLWKRKDGH